MSEFDDTLLEEDLLSLPSVSDYEETLDNNSIQTSNQEDSIDEILNINLLETLRELNEEICADDAVAKQNNFINHKRNLIVYDLDYYDNNHNQIFELKKSAESTSSKKSLNNIKDLRNKLKKLKKHKKRKNQRSVTASRKINDRCSNKHHIVSEYQESSTNDSSVQIQSPGMIQNLNLPNYFLPTSAQISESQITKCKKCNSTMSNLVDLTIPSENVPQNFLESCFLHSKFLNINQEENHPSVYECQSEKNYRARNILQNNLNNIHTVNRTLPNSPKEIVSFKDNISSVPYSKIVAQNRTILSAYKNQATSLPFYNLNNRDELLILSKNQSIQCNESSAPLVNQCLLSSPTIGINSVGNFPIQESNSCHRQLNINLEYAPSSLNLMFHSDDKKKQNKDLQNLQLNDRLGPSPPKVNVPSSMNHQNYPFTNSHLTENSRKSKNIDDQLLFVLDKLNPRNVSQTSFTRNHNFTVYQTQNKDSIIPTEKNNYEENLFMGTKRDDPYTYFSDIWQSKNTTEINKDMTQKQSENKTKDDLKKKNQRLKDINITSVTKPNKLKHTSQWSDDKSKKNSIPTNLKNNTKAIENIEKKRDRKSSTENTIENSTKKIARSAITKEQSKFNADFKKKQSEKDIEIIFTMDDEMREYCKKVEEQKQRRKEFLEKKEKKRKLLEDLKISENKITKGA